MKRPNSIMMASQKVTSSALFVVIAVMALAAVFVPASAEPSSVGNTGADDALLTAAQTGSAVIFEADLSYEEYLGLHGGTARPDVTIEVPIDRFTSGDLEVEVQYSFEGFEGPVVLTGEEGYVEWEVDIEQAGLYNIAITYYPLPGKGGDLQRELWINGDAPFFGSRFLTFNRVWQDAEGIRRDNRGNELRARQIEAPMWRYALLGDDMGYFQEPYMFYFQQGKNTLRLISLKEPMAIGSVTLLKFQELLPYESVIEQYSEMGYKPSRDFFLKIQGEHATFKSDPTLYADFDRSDPLVEPYHPVEIRLNTIGGHRWQLPGQWISWEFDVPEAGLYEIAFKAKQNLVRGSYSNRRILINGVVPFAEADAVRFRYNTQYDMTVLGGEKGSEPYLVYLPEGKNTLTLEVVLGDLGSLLQTAESVLFSLNEAYRQIIMITSSVPDPVRDYRLDRRLPGTIANMREQAQTIDLLAAELEGYTGEKGSHIALLNTISRQLMDMVNRPHTIPGRLGAFRDNLGALGTWILQTRNQPLLIDYIVVASPGTTLPRTEPTFLEHTWHEIRSFFASFFVDYDLVGDVYEVDDDSARRVPLKVWIATGRDQATALKEMIEDTFTPHTGILVNLELVNLGILLPATLAGLGPDVALGLPSSDPINFALRGALLDFTKFSGFDELRSEFHPSAFTPFTFRDSIYAVPEQQPFPMLFYREDILHELGLEIPQTWDDVFHIIPELQKEHLNFGLPVSSVETRQAGAGDIGMTSAGAGSIATYQGVVPFLTFLYQNGGSIYREDGVTTDLASEVSIEAFRNWTELYELYHLPLQYDLANRFRTGEIPIIMADYPFYNLLSVFAPEIRGRWNFTLVPGTEGPDGIDRTVPSSTVIGSVIMSDTRDPNAAWEFVRWWTSVETQVRYGRELESLMGPAARYPAANMEAVAQLPWTFLEQQKLAEQWQYVRGVPEVPGGYMVGRHLDNAFRRVVYQKEDPRETILDYVRVINEEIRIKREEFGLETDLEQL